jgi:hypothetical protein
VIKNHTNLEKRYKLTVDIVKKLDTHANTTANIKINNAITKAMDEFTNKHKKKFEIIREEMINLHAPVDRQINNLK